MAPQITPKLPPQNNEAEQSVLGAILIENEALLKAIEIIHPENFYRESHRLIFRSMIELFEKNAKLAELSNQLKDEELLLEKKRQEINDLNSKENLYSEKLSKLMDDVEAHEQKCNSIKNVITQLETEEEDKKNRVNELSDQLNFNQELVDEKLERIA